jgi:hypothetical protein
VLLGAGAGTKYLGLFWVGAVTALVAVVSLPVPRSVNERLKSIALVSAVALAILLPWYWRIVYYTGNPLFPFASSIFGHTIWDGGVPPGSPNALITIVRLPWDSLMSRSAIGNQPPFSPVLILSLPFIIWSAFRGDRRTQVIVLLSIVWALVWTELPRDGRYLTLLFPLLAVAGASALRSVLPAKVIALLTTLTLLIAPLYATLRLKIDGWPPLTAVQRERWLHAYIPQYAAIAHLNRIAKEGDVAYVWGAEQLQYHYHRGLMIGDHTGPARYSLMSGAKSPQELAQRMDKLRVRFVMVVPANGGWNLKEPYFRAIYRDAHATVYQRMR